MKRFLLATGLILLILLVLGFIAPKQYVLERSIQIDAPKSHVYEFMNSLESLHAWSSDLHGDSSVLVTYHGTSGTVGASATWKGRKSITEGKETIQRVLPFDRIETQIRHLRPWESLNHATISVRGKGEKCTVTWHFDGHSPFPFNIRHLFADMDKVLGPKYERDLRHMKTLAEKAYLKKKLQLQYGVIPDKKYAYFTSEQPKTVALGTVVGVKRGELAKKIGIDSLVEMIHPCFQITASGKQEELSGRMALAFPIQIEVPDIQADVVEGGRVLTARYNGGHDGLRRIHEEIKTFLRHENQGFRYPIEEVFMVCPPAETDSTKWLTLVHYRLRNSD